MGENRLNRMLEGASEMGDRGIDLDHQIEAADSRCRTDLQAVRYDIVARKKRREKIDGAGTPAIDFIGRAAGQGKTDLEPRAGRRVELPGLRRWRQIGFCRRHIVRMGAENMRQAGERRMAIEFRYFAAKSNRFGDAVDSAQQTRERFMAGENDAPAPLGHKQREADELQAVAKALLGMEQNGCAVQRRVVLAWPRGVRHRAAGEFEAPLIFGKTGFVIAGAEQVKGLVGMRLGEFGLKRDRPLIGGAGFRFAG